MRGDLSLVRGSSNSFSSQNQVDGGNLNLNTNTLNYSNLANHSNSSSNSIGQQVGIQLDSTTPNNINLNYANSSTKLEGITKATIGQGSINIGGKSITQIINEANQIKQQLAKEQAQNTIIDEITGETIILATITPTSEQQDKIDEANRLSSLNRNINQTQIITKNQVNGGYNIDLNISPKILTESYALSQQDKLLEVGMRNLGGNLELNYKLTPMGTDRDIEATRGSKQSFAWGGPAVYKSGDETNGVRDEMAIMLD